VGSRWANNSNHLNAPAAYTSCCLYYLAWIRSVADHKQDPELEIQASAWHHLDMNALRKTLAEKAPAQWSTEVYGTSTYQARLYIQAGRFIPLRPSRKKEVAHPGQSPPGQAA